MEDASILLVDDEVAIVKMLETVLKKKDSTKFIKLTPLKKRWMFYIIKQLILFCWT